MLEVDTGHEIILMHFHEGKGIRQIAKELKIHRKTVRSRIEHFEQLRRSQFGEGKSSMAVISKYLQTGATYDSSTRSRPKLTEQITSQIDACLAENEKKREDGRRKQQLKKIDIHEKLTAAGIKVSYSSICKYIAAKDKAKRTQEAFIKQGYEPGGACEFDWGEVRLNVDGSYRRFYMAVFTSAYSNYRFAILFERQNSLSFREAHIIFFAHVGGVWHQMTYDNMRVAIAEFVGKTEKMPTEALSSLSHWYVFRWRFCNIARGNEKGHVERSVEYVRRKVFAFRDEFESLEDAQMYLVERLSELNQRVPNGAKKSPYDMLLEEKSGLVGYPGKMECFDGDHCKVDKYATICVGTNRYSVPDRFTGKMVFVKNYSSHIQVYEGEEIVCRHPRSYKRFDWQINLNHYLVTLKRKPGAIADSIALKQAPSWIRALYKEHFLHDSRSFIELLQYCQTNNISHAQLKATSDRLSRQYPANVDADHIIALLGNQPDDSSKAPKIQGPDPIAEQSMKNLTELTSMME